MRVWVGLVVACAVGSGLGCNKKEAGPRPNPRCDLGDGVSLRKFCDQDDAWRDTCESYAHYDAALEAMIADCTATAFPVAVGNCDLRVLERNAGTNGQSFYYDDDGDLVGIRLSEDESPDCPEGSPGAEEPLVNAGRTAEDSCETCHLCGATLEDDPEVCSGETAEPYVQQCLDSFDFVPGCAECACGACYPWTLSSIEDTAREFHACVSDHCAICAEPTDDDDGGTEPAEPDEDAGR